MSIYTIKAILRDALSDYYFVSKFRKLLHNDYVTCLEKLFYKRKIHTIIINARICCVLL